MKLIITDLDGTLLNDEQLVSNTDFDVLKQLGEIGAVRAIATGRSLFSVNNVIYPDFPIDFMIFSTGAGIMNWNNKEIILKQELSAIKTTEIINILIKQNVDFMIHKGIPNNHEFYYHCFDKGNKGFQNRINIYTEVAIPIESIPSNFRATQFVVILPNDLQLFSKICKKLKGVKIIRTTSPINDDHIWLEIFPEDVSKGHAAIWLANKLGIEIIETVAIGNDYNDIDMLDITGNSYVVDNAPADLKEKYKIVKSNNNNGFSEAVKKSFGF
ncbi:MAG: HAD family hydrolase [Bacteroidota bacterium]